MTDAPIDTRDCANSGTAIPAAIELRGNFEGIGLDGSVSGWCWSPDEPTVRRRVVVELDGVVVLSLVAADTRADLVDAAVGDGAHAFVGVVPEAARAPGETCVVAVRDVASGQQIGGNASISWPGGPEPPEPPALNGALDRVTRDGWVSGWCWYPSEPERRVELAVLVDGEVVGRTRAASLRPDLAQAGIGDGAHAFSYALPWSVMGSKGLMTIAVQDAETARPLGDPIVLRLGKMAATEERIEDLERQMRLLRGHIEELTDRARRPVDDPAKALFRTVGVFFQELSEDVASGRAIGPATGLRGAIADVTGRFAPLALAVPDAPAATVVIDASVPFDRLYACIAALHAVGVDRAAEIVLVDDGGGGGEAALLPLVVRNLRLLHVRPGTGLAAGRNEAAREARGAVIVFLAPELEVGEGWLAGLLATFAREPQAAVIGSRVVRSDGTLLHAGLIADGNGVLRAVGKGEPASHPAFAFMRPVHAVPDLAMAVRREAWTSVGGFSLGFRSGAASAIDLCLRLRQQGHAVLVQAADTTRWAAEPGPVAARVVPDFSLGEDDAALLEERKLRPGWLADTDPGIPRVRPGGHALVVDTEMPRPDRDAGSVATLEQMRLLCRLGYHVIFAPADGDLVGPTETHRLEALGIEVARPPGSASVTECLEERGAWLDLVQVYRHANAGVFLERIRALAPRARLIFSPADLHFLREAREAQVTGRDTADADATRTAELSCIEAADATILPSDHEVAVLSELVPPEKLVLLRWIARAEPSDVPFAARHGACFVGNFSHGPNADGVLWFVREILPLVRAQIPAFRFHVAGSNMGADIQALASDAVVVHGWVADLAPFFATMRASLAPLRYGAGFKGKVGTSLAHGLPAIVTATALEGTGLADGDGVRVGDDAEGFATALIRVHEDAVLWADLSRIGLARCAELFSPDAALEIYRSLLARLRLPALSPARG